MCAGGCVTPAAYDPFAIPAAELRGRVDTIAISPLRVGPHLADPSETRALIEPRVAERLERGGFRVVPSAAFDALWRSAAATVGDVYDRETGERNKERWEAVEAAVLLDLAAKHGADAVLYLQIDTVDLHLAPENVQFCATQGQLYWPTGWAWGTPAVLARAACLGVGLYDMEERRLYSIRTGLMTTETYAQQTHAERAAGEVLRDKAVLERALEEVLGPLAGEAPAKTK